MIGEIRDNETADIAVKATLTGQQVLCARCTQMMPPERSRVSTTWASSRFSFPPRSLYVSSASGAPHLPRIPREEFIPEPEILEKLGMGPKRRRCFITVPAATVANAAVSGRPAIIEVLPVTEAMRRLIIKRASAAVIKTQGSPKE